jgi:glyoxylase-like metal-dependent hydrolase (beta-lactamase superfamily II)
MSVVAVESIVTARVPLTELYLHRGSPLKLVRCPCLAFVLRHPAAGAVLVDTGLGSGFERRLLDRAIDPSEVETVLMTHLHLDHTSGMRLLENARFWISRREWRAAQGKLAAAKGVIGHHLPDEDRVELVDVENGEPHGPFASTVDVLGDGSVRLVSTPGHTPGHMSVLVRTASGEVLLAGDAAYTLRNVREQALPLISADAGRYRASLAQLAAFPGPVVPSHDPQAYLSL